MFFRRLLLFASFLPATVGDLWGQQFPLRKLTVEDGVGHSIVYRTTQTSDGYLWFSTDNGLTRFDGNNFRNFTTDDGLPSNFIFDVAEWDGKMFISTLGGGVVIYENNSFSQAFASDSGAPLHPVEIRISDQFFFIIDRFKNLFFLKGNKFYEATPVDFGLVAGSGLEVFNVELTDDAALIATNHGLFTFSDGVFLKVDLKLDFLAFVHRVSKISDTRILIVINDLLMEYDLESHHHAILFEGEVLARFTRMKMDSEGNIWLSTVNGNLYLLPHNGRSYGKLRVFDDIVINDIFEDREKNLWLSTYGEGVWLIQSTRVRNHPIKGYIVSDLGVDPASGNLLVTTINAGLKVFQLEENHFLREINTNPLGAMFADDIFLGPVKHSSSNSILLGASHTLVHLQDDSTTVAQLNKPITSILFQERRNRIWVGCRFGLAYCDSAMNSMTQVQGFENTVARSIEELPDGRIVVGTDIGLLVEHGDAFTPFPAETALENATINTLLFDKHRNMLWAGTNAGLAWVQNGELRLVDNPLTRIRCNSITHDGNGTIFVGSVRGLIHYDGNRFEVLSTKEGLTQANIMRLMYHEKENVLTLLSSNSISTIDTQYFPDILHFELPNMLIQNIATEDEQHVFSGRLIELATPTKQLAIKLSTPQIRNRDKVAFRYRVNDKAWTTFNGSEITLHSLPTGMMTIAIQAHKINNESDAKTLTLSFYIPPPFYLKWWFIALLVVGVAIIFSVMVVYYSRNRNRKLLEENRRLDVEHKALRNLLNPHFLSNAINSIHAFILQNDQRQTLGYLSKFSQLVRLNLELLSSEQVTLDKEIKNISLYLEFEKLRFTDKLNYTIEIDPDVVQSDISIPPFIIQPFVENAIWHGLLPRKEGGNLMLRVTRKNEAVAIIIEDDGIGIKQSLRHPKAEIDKKASMGINIIYERFELLKKVDPLYNLDITDKIDLNGSASGTGTIITLIIPAEATQNL